MNDLSLILSQYDAILKRSYIKELILTLIHFAFIYRMPPTRSTSALLTLIVTRAERHTESPIRVDYGASARHHKQIANAKSKPPHYLSIHTSHEYLDQTPWRSHLPSIFAGGRFLHMDIPQTSSRKPWRGKLCLTTHIHTPCACIITD